MSKPYRSPPGIDVDYGRVIKDSLGLIWRHRFLWFFGFFAGTSSTFGGWSCDYNFYVTSPGEDESSSARAIAESLIDWMQDHLTLVIIVLAASFVVGLLLWLWSVLCHGAVVGTVGDIEEGRPVSYRSAFGHGTANFRRLLPYMFIFTAAPVLLSALLGGFGLLLYYLFTSAGDAGTAAGVIILILMVIPLTGATVPTLGFLAFAGFVPVAMVAYILAFNFGSRGIVLGGLRAIGAVRHGVGLMFANLMKSGFLYIISVGVSIGASIVMVFALLLASIPAIAAWIFSYSAGMPVPWVAAAILLSALPLAAVVLFTAAFNTYFTVYWTDAWMLFTGRKEHRKPGRAR